MRNDKPAPAPAAAMPRALHYPEGHGTDASHGPLQIDGTQGGRLARLKDVTRYLVDRYRLTPVEATEWLCDALDAVTPDLFMLQEGRRAVPLAADIDFFAAGFVNLSFWETQPPSQPDDLGFAGAVKHMRQYWDGSERARLGEHVVDPLAIRLRDAFDLWGYGTQEPAHKATGDVQPLSGWQPNTVWGFMGFDSTPAGRLVRLADVVRWIEADKALPRSKAVEALCEGMHAGALGALYRLQPGEFAEPQPPNHAYGYRKASQPQAAPVAPGLPALLRRIRDTWGSAPAARNGAAGDVLDATPGELAGLAITVDMAYALWGWGSAAGAQSDDAAQPEGKKSALLALLDAFEKRGSKTLNQFAPEHGLTPANAKKRLIAARKLKAEAGASASGPWAALQVVGGKKVAKK